MRSNIGVAWGVAILLALAVSPPANADPASDKVLECMRGNIPPQVRIQDFEITSVDRTGGTRTLRGKLHAKRDGELARVMLRIEAPSDLAGSAYLIREGKGSDEVYLYLPATRKVRRINGPNQDNKLWGTDLSFNDIKQLQNAYSGASLKLEPAAAIDSRPAHVLGMVPRPGETTRYNQLRAWVDQKTCVALKVEFSDSGGVRKRITANPKALKQNGKFWFASEAEMADISNGTSTRIKVFELSSPAKIADRLFNPQTFYLGG
jgi:outer membrane lipoprotein-sorting protein